MITITDEQIREIFNSHKVNLSTPDINPAIYDAARDLIALAQEVMPLVFGRNEDGDLVCRTGCKIYVILNLSEGFGYAGRLYEIEEKAIAAAQDDFTRITLSNLVHGGKNET